MNLRDMKKERKKGQFMFKLWYHGMYCFTAEQTKKVGPFGM